MMQTPWSTTQSMQKKASYLSSVGGSYDLDDDWNPDDADEQSATVPSSPFRFQAQGEEVVLMPPSQTRSSRTGIV